MRCNISEGALLFEVVGEDGLLLLLLFILILSLFVLLPSH